MRTTRTFGPFPGAPFNPSAALAKHLARRRRPALADVDRTAHVFATRYAPSIAICPDLLATHPDIVLMFGLAARTPALRIETRARNAVSVLLPDAGGRYTQGGVIARGKPPALRSNAPARTLLHAARSARVAVACCRAMPAATCAITPTGARWKNRQTAGRWCSSCTFRWCDAPRCDTYAHEASSLRLPIWSAPVNQY